MNFKVQRKKNYNLKKFNGTDNETDIEIEVMLHSFIDLSEFTIFFASSLLDLGKDLNLESLFGKAKAKYEFDESGKTKSIQEDGIDFSKVAITLSKLINDKKNFDKVLRFLGNTTVGKLNCYTDSDELYTDDLGFFIDVLTCTLIANYESVVKKKMYYLATYIEKNLPSVSEKITKAKSIFNNE